MCGAWQKRQLTTEFITKKNYREVSRTVGGVVVSTIETDVGTFNVASNRYTPAGKDALFSEPLAGTGSVDRAQIYGEIGLECGAGDRPRQDHRPDHGGGAYVKFISTKHPKLIVHDLGVIFRDGEAEVTDKFVVDALRRLPADLGVRAVGGRPSTTAGTFE